LSNTPRNPVATAAARAQTEARAGGYGPDSTDVQALARAAMALSPASAARVGAMLLRAAIERDPSVLAVESVASDVVAAGRVILSVDRAAA
jgi:hypothetical protein